MRVTLVYKLTFSIAFLVLVVTTMVGYLFFTKTTSVLVAHTLQDLASEIKVAGDSLKTKINVQHDDVLFLANAVPVQEIFYSIELDDQKNYNKWRKRLELIFSTMLGSKKTYLKIRLIDKNGQELIVVVRDGKNINLSYGVELQNKSHRKYLQKTVKLKNGAVYLSDISLNREHGEVSEPHQEVFRSATPIYNKKKNEIFGILIISSEIGYELRKIEKNFQGVNRKIYITNDQGGYLLHPDIGKRYGFDLGKRYRIQEDIPKLEKLFTTGNQDSSYIETPKSGKNLYVVNLIKLFFDPADSERFIAIGMTELYASIIEKESDVLNDVIYLTLIFSSVIILLALFLSYRLFKPITQITKVMDDYIHQRESSTIMPKGADGEIGILAASFEALMSQVEQDQSKLKGMNNELEAMVAERTHELLVSEVKQRSILENIVDGIITINHKGGIESFNPAAEKIFGYKINEVEYKNIKMLMPDPYHSEHDEYLENYHTTGVKKIIGIKQELVARRKDGSCFPMELAISEVYVNEKKLYTGIIRDITERKYIEKLKDEFVSTVSHELRTPLTSIRGSLELLISGVVGDIPETANKMLKIASSNSEKLLVLINDILDIQKFESGKFKFNFKKLDVVKFINKAIRGNTPYANNYRVNFKLKTNLSNTYVSADKERLMQVMSNLLSNAAKFSKGNGNVDIELTKDNNRVRFCVTDYGAGIPEEFHSKVFDKFTQFDSSDSRESGGTGLGLSIAKYIIEQHNGELGFTSSQDSGSSFYFSLDELRM